jgi:hypothetical protein
MQDRLADEVMRVPAKSRARSPATHRVFHGLAVKRQRVAFMSCSTFWRRRNVSRQ